jgi:uncharacterized protein (DUF2235 family)
MKRLIVCCDGTWQDLDQKAADNVVKISQAIKPTAKDNVAQIVYYDEGIGSNTGIPLAQAIEKFGGGAFGWGIDHKIQDAYRFLCLNYEPGDEIYLFGFSRGAYTARSLGGLLYNAGLLRRDCLRKLSAAYELYRSRAKEAKPSHQFAADFRKKYCIDYCPPNGYEAVDQGRVPVKALCCWDTVCALGIPNLVSFVNLDQHLRKRYEFFDHHVNRLVEFAFHAAAIDEIRAAYNVTPMEHCKDCEDKQQIRQVWFPGDHGCVGGGDPSLQGLSDAALVWMMDQVEPLGLDLDKSKIEGGIKVNYRTHFDNTPKGIDRLTGEVYRSVYGGFNALHESVIQRWHDPELLYRSKNLRDLQELLDACAPSISERRNLGTKPPVVSER